jgi:uncharacterized protein
MTDDASLEVLSEAECRRLLAENHVGRVAFVDGDYPVVLPVNYLVDGNAVALRTDAGTKFDAIPLRRVAFEIDRFEKWNHSGWSVLVQGFGHDVSDAIGTRYEELREGGLETWVPGDRAYWLMIEIQHISGRRIVRQPGVTSEVIE